MLGEPTGGLIEAGCQGTLRVVVRAARNAGPFGPTVVGRQRDSQTRRRARPAGGIPARSVDIDGCTYREGLSAVRVDGGGWERHPDAATVTVNFRFAPDRTPQQALVRARVFDGLDVAIEQTDAAAGALPGLSRPAAARLVAAAGGKMRAKYGWTDVSLLPPLAFRRSTTAR